VEEQEDVLWFIRVLRRWWEHGIWIAEIDCELPVASEDFQTQLRQARSLVPTAVQELFQVLLEDVVLRESAGHLRTELAKHSPLCDKFPAPLLNPSALAKQSLCSQCICGLQALAQGIDLSQGHLRQCEVEKRELRSQWRPRLQRRIEALQAKAMRSADSSSGLV